MLKVSGLTKTFGAQKLLDNVSFSINAGEKIGLIGRNGSGKTTLARILLGQEEPEAGKISLPKGYTIGYLEQHIRFTRPTVLEEACLGLPPGQEYDHWRVEKILSGLGFTEADFQRPPSEFSGGFHIRLNLTKTLVSEPDLLLLDEPTNYLDIISIRWLEKYLREWKQEFMLITHDRRFLDRVTTHTMIIHRRCIRKIQGPTDKLYAQIAQEEEVHEKTRLNEAKYQKETELFISRFRAKARLAGMVQSRIKTLEKREKKGQLEKLVELDFNFNALPFPAHQMLETRDFSFRYGDDLPWLIKNLSFTLGSSERIAVIGKNGKGKSTLLKLLAGEISPVQGSFKTHPRLETGFFGQTNILRLNLENTIEEELIATEPNHNRERARSIAGVMLFSGDTALKKINVLSGGEKARVLMAKTLLSPSHLLLLDEPTNHLDMESSASLLEAMQEYPGSIVFVTHDEDFLHTLAEKLIVFDRDRVLVYHGIYQNFLDDIGWEDEETVAQKATPPQSPPPEETAAVVIPVVKKDPRQARQARAKIIQEKSKTCHPLEKRQENLEKMIEKLEAEIGRNTQRQIKASTEGDAATIAEVPQTNRDLQAQVDFLYKDLERAHRELDLAANKFEKKLAEL